MRNELFVKSFSPGAAIAANRIIKMGAANGAVLQATAGTGIGVANGLGAAAADDYVDVVLAGIAEIEYGDTVARGDRLTADADGKAVPVSDGGDKHALIAGAAAGDHTVTGIATTDELLAVFEADQTSAILVDHTAEFSITAANTINNAEGTDTSNDKLLVLYRSPTWAVGIALEAGSSGDIRGALLAPGNA